MTIADVIAARTGHDDTVASSDGPRASRPKRRTFSAEYKLRILEEYENAPDPQHRNALLRREGIYTSTISEWRRTRDNAMAGAIPEKKRGRPARDAAGRRHAWQSTATARAAQISRIRASASRPSLSVAP